MSSISFRPQCVKEWNTRPHSTISAADDYEAQWASYQIRINADAAMTDVKHAITVLVHIWNLWLLNWNYLSSQWHLVEIVNSYLLKYVHKESALACFTVFIVSICFVFWETLV